MNDQRAIRRVVRGTEVARAKVRERAHAEPGDRLRVHRVQVELLDAFAVQRQRFLVTTEAQQGICLTEQGPAFDLPVAAAAAETLGVAVELPCALEVSPVQRHGAELRVALRPEANVTEIARSLDRSRQSGLRLRPATPSHVGHRDAGEAPCHVVRRAGAFRDLEDPVRPPVGEGGSRQEVGEVDGDHVAVRELHLGTRGLRVVHEMEHRPHDRHGPHRVEGGLDQPSLHAGDLRGDALARHRIDGTPPERRLQEAERRCRGGAQHPAHLSRGNPAAEVAQRGLGVARGGRKIADAEVSLGEPALDHAEPEVAPSGSIPALGSSSARSVRLRGRGRRSGSSVCCAVHSSRARLRCSMASWHAPLCKVEHAGLVGVRGLLHRVVRPSPMVRQRGNPLRTRGALAFDRDADGAMELPTLRGGQIVEQLLAELVVREAPALLMNLEHRDVDAVRQPSSQINVGMDRTEQLGIDGPPDDGGGRQRPQGPGRVRDAACDGAPSPCRRRSPASGDSAADLRQASLRFGQGTDDLDDEEGDAFGLALQEVEQLLVVIGRADHGFDKRRRRLRVEPPESKDVAGPTISSR